MKKVTRDVLNGLGTFRVSETSTALLPLTANVLVLEIIEIDGLVANERTALTPRNKLLGSGYEFRFLRFTTRPCSAAHI